MINGERVRMMRLNQEWTQRELAKLTDISESEISKIEKSIDPNREYTIQTVIRLCQVFGAKVEELLIPVELVVTPEQVRLGQQGRDPAPRKSASR